MIISLVSIGLVLCILLSAFFSASEMAFSSCNTVRLENIEEDKAKGWKKARAALKITDDFDSALSAILIGNNLVNIASSSLASVLVILIMGNDRFTWIATVILTVLVIIFGETIPKISAKKNSTGFAMKASGAITVMIIIFKPVIWVVVGLVRLITLPLKQAKDDEADESVEELQSIIETAEDEGIIDESDSNLMQAAIDFADISASEVMTARVDMLAIDIDDSWTDIRELIENSPYSRIPVYQDSIDNIIGILHLNMVLKALTENEDNSLFSQEETPIDLRPLLMKPCYVYKAMKLPKVLNTLKSAKQHLAIVTDEYSGTLGVVSMEDVLEQIVGEIYDETDEVDPDVVVKNDNEFEVDGDLPIGDFLELVGIDEESFEAESDTVGGWVVEKLGHFPTSGETFEDNQISIKVISMDGLRVEKILVDKLSHPGA